MKEGFHVSFIFHGDVLSEGSGSGKLVRYGGSKHGMKRYGLGARCVYFAIQLEFLCLQ